MNALQRIVNIKKYGEIALATGVVGIVLLLIIPLPPLMLDLLISINILFSITTLLVTLYIKEPLEFSAFPSLLLFLTLFRLGINISSTRMILIDAQAGNVINTFGKFVTGGSQFVGVIIFVLLTIINFVVITKGSGRIAEVTARFTLDAMPGKQMAIDADLNAGIINEDEAKERRLKVSLESDFYGSMDGASKFVKGDAIAGIIITIINVLAGFAIGIVDKGMSWSNAIDTYTTLSVGDGLVSQIPSLLISVGAGIVVTRSSSQEGLGTTLTSQVFSDYRVLFVSSAIIMALGIIPGMPFFIMTVISSILCLYAYQLKKVAEKDSITTNNKQNTLKTSSPSKKKEKNEDKVEDALFIDLMEINLGYSLIALVDQQQGGDLLKRINVIRRQIASELGLIVPPIRIRDNISIKGDAYSIKIKGVEVSRGFLQVDNFLAMASGEVSKTLRGTRVIEPAFGLEAVWISAIQREDAEASGYTVVDAISVLATHLTEVIHSNAHEILNRQGVSKIIDNAKKHAPAVVEELIPSLLSLGQVLQVLQNLLKERISIRDIISILEILANNASKTKDSIILTEYVRQGLARNISQKYSEDSKIYSILLDSKVEDTIAASVQRGEFGQQITLHPKTVKNIVESIKKIFENSEKNISQCVILTSPIIRPAMFQIIERYFPRLAVISFYEIVPDIEIESIGSIPSDVLC